MLDHTLNRHSPKRTCRLLTKYRHLAQLHLIEGQLVQPLTVGRRFEVNGLVVLLEARLLKMRSRVAKMAGRALVEKIRAESNVNFGYNALTHEYGDLVKMGVIVPTKVERIALENAASIASLLGQMGMNSPAFGRSFASLGNIKNRALDAHGRALH